MHAAVMHCRIKVEGDIMVPLSALMGMMHGELVESKTPKISAIDLHGSLPWWILDIYLRERYEDAGRLFL